MDDDDQLLVKIQTLRHLSQLYEGLSRIHRTRRQRDGITKRREKIARLCFAIGLEKAHRAWLTEKMFSKEDSLNRGAFKELLASTKRLTQFYATYARTIHNKDGMSKRQLELDAEEITLRKSLSAAGKKPRQVPMLEPEPEPRKEAKSSSSSSSSSSWDLDGDSSTEEKDAPVAQKPYWFDGKEPFVFNPLRDGYFLDRRDDQYNSRLPIDKEKSYFSRDIRSQPYGAFLSKHCAPYGKADLLAKGIFSLMSKFFSPEGEVIAVLIKSTQIPYREFLLEPIYFSGWCDQKTLKSWTESVKLSAVNK